MCTINTTLAFRKIDLNYWKEIINNLYYIILHI